MDILDKFINKCNKQDKIDRKVTLKIQHTRKILDFGVLGLWVLEFWECWGFGDEKVPFSN